jgi:hypothetical protein
MEALETDRIRILLAREGDYWVGQCLELDIGARDLNELTRRLTLAIAEEREEAGGGMAGPSGPLLLRLPISRSCGSAARGGSSHRHPPSGDGVDIEFGISA